MVGRFGRQGKGVSAARLRLRAQSTRMLQLECYLIAALQVVRGIYEQCSVALVGRVVWLDAAVDAPLRLPQVDGTTVGDRTTSIRPIAIGTCGPCPWICVKRTCRSAIQH